LDEVILSFPLHGFGTIRPSLYGRAQETANFLAGLDEDMIERLRTLDHLGAIRHAFGTAHHSRLEYLVLQMEFIRRIKEVDSTLGCGSNIDIGSSYRPSVAELLQIWALVFNAARLEGTYDSEQGLLEAMRLHQGLSSTFRKGLREPGITPKALGQFQDTALRGTVYGLKPYLTIFFLKRSRRRAPELVDFLVRAVDYWISGDDSKHSDVLDKYNKIRKLAYLYLDSRYGPVPMNLDLAYLFLNLQDYIDPLFLNPESPLNHFLEGLETFLENRLYFSDEALVQHVHQVNRARNTILEQKKLQSLPAIKKTLYEEVQMGSPSSDYTDILRLSVPTDGQATSAIADMERALRQDLPTRQAEVAAFLNPAFTKAILAVCFRKGLADQQVARALGNITEEVYRYMERVLAITEVTEAQADHSTVLNGGDFTVMLMGLIHFVLNRFSTGCRIGLSRSTVRTTSLASADGLHKVQTLATRGSTSAAIRFFDIEQYKDSTRKHELQILRTVLQTIEHRGIVITCDVPFQVWSSSREELITDLDGVALLVTRTRLELLVVEAKDRRTGAGSAAKGQLEDRTKQIRWKTAGSDRPEVNTVHEGAYVRLCLYQK